MGPRFVTVCDRGGGQKSLKIAWHTLWTATNVYHLYTIDNIFISDFLKIKKGNRNGP